MYSFIRSFFAFLAGFLFASTLLADAFAIFDAQFLLILAVCLREPVFVFCSDIWILLEISGIPRDEQESVKPKCNI
jgi:hypothetical protein